MPVLPARDSQSQQRNKLGLILHLVCGLNVHTVSGLNVHVHGLHVHKGIIQLQDIKTHSLAVQINS